ncbi:phosphoribosylglycinamide formyltransferase [Chrysiogenes arsenatis]|uniref:phosphoribosylglycinamide formyltransferase n=1 Tax=Chrysiogenes arsenatis TaxID=309797 RepID=UPI000405DDD9|nr:phosphoribosylglycinamide formyltransferase [Chrysiogenes arsenatis]
MAEKIAVLLSGRGSNFLAIARNIQSGIVTGCAIDVVLSNKSDAPGLIAARDMGIATAVFRQKDYADKGACEQAMVTLLRERGVQWIVLAGYMRILGADFIDAFAGRILNIHPSLLPAFIGLDAQKQALDYGVKVAGCTVHFVTNELDGGPILLQKVVPVLDDDDEASLCARILEQEHIAYSEALELVVHGKVYVDGRRVRRR